MQFLIFSVGFWASNQWAGSLCGKAGFLRRLGSGGAQDIQGTGCIWNPLLHQSRSVWCRLVRRCLHPSWKNVDMYKFLLLSWLRMTLDLVVEPIFSHQHSRTYSWSGFVFFFSWRNLNPHFSLPWRNQQTVGWCGWALSHFRLSWTVTQGQRIGPCRVSKSGHP